MNFAQALALACQWTVRPESNTSMIGMLPGALSLLSENLRVVTGMAFESRSIKLTECEICQGAGRMRSKKGHHEHHSSRGWLACGRCMGSGKQQSVVRGFVCGGQFIVCPCDRGSFVREECPAWDCGPVDVLDLCDALSLLHDHINNRVMYTLDLTSVVAVPCESHDSISSVRSDITGRFTYRGCHICMPGIGRVTAAAPERVNEWLFSSLRHTI